MEVLRRDIRKAFADVDLLITPTQRGPAGLITPAAPAPDAARGAAPAGAGGGGGGLNNTSALNIYGLPTISVPCGFTKDGLPIGLQISGAPFAESTVIALAYAYQQATEWHKRRPKPTSRRAHTTHECRGNEPQKAHKGNARGTRLIDQSFSCAFLSLFVPFVVPVPVGNR